MQFIATRLLLVVFLCAFVAGTAASAPNDHPPRYLQEPVLGIRLEPDRSDLDPLPESIRARCDQIADDERWTGQMWIFAQASDASGTYYIVAGHFRRRQPLPGKGSYDTGSQGGIYILRGSTCGGDPARETFDVRDFEQTPRATLQALLLDLAARLVRALGGPHELRAQIRKQRIDFDQLSPELQAAFAPYFEP